MAFRKRRDGIYLKKLPAFRRIFPYLMPTRDESIIFASQKIGVDRLLDWLEKLNRGRDKPEKITFFHCMLTAAARVFRLRPQLNRFVAGKRIYRHKDITITFIVKKAMAEEADESEARVVFSGEETLAEVRDKVNRHIARARGAEKGSDDKLIDFVGGLPRPILNFVDRLFRWLDYHNIMLGFLMETIPLYTSVYLANLGSLDLNAVYHHLYEYGTASTFAVIGKIHKEPWVDERDRISVRRCVEMSFTLDERVSEGFYYARSIALLTALLEHPELLDRPELSAEEIFAAAEGGGTSRTGKRKNGKKRPGR
ncbi:MAG: 2-oxo acid dehydrogenase subunit E2 [Spirochaetales bacterium]|nr:2-oxo acid dehydrogenase subunit E2 [Spirochaetales bacterium]